MKKTLWIIPAALALVAVLAGCAVQTRPANALLFATVQQQVAAQVGPAYAQALRPMEENAYQQALDTVGAFAQGDILYCAGVAQPASVVGATLQEYEANFAAALALGETGAQLNVPVHLQRRGNTWGYHVAQVDVQQLYGPLYSAYAGGNAAQLLHSYLFDPAAHDHTLNLLLNAGTQWTIMGETVTDVQRLYRELDVLRALFTSVRDLTLAPAEVGMTLTFTAVDYEALMQRDIALWASLDARRGRDNLYTLLSQPLVGDHPRRQYSFPIASLTLTDPQDGTLPFLLQQWCTPIVAAVDAAAQAGVQWCQQNYPAPQAFPAAGVQYGPQTLRWIATAQVTCNQAQDCVFYLYDSTGALYARGYLPQGQQVSVRLCADSYTLRFGCGPTWMGDEVLFGAEGDYYELTAPLAVQAYAAYDITLQRTARDVRSIGFAALRACGLQLPTPTEE